MGNSDRMVELSQVFSLPWSQYQTAHTRPFHRKSDELRNIFEEEIFDPKYADKRNLYKLDKGRREDRSVAVCRQS